VQATTYADRPLDSDDDDTAELENQIYGGYGEKEKLVAKVRSYEKHFDASRVHTKAKKYKEQRDKSRIETRRLMEDKHAQKLRNNKNAKRLKKQNETVKSRLAEARNLETVRLIRHNDTREELRHSRENERVAKRTIEKQERLIRVRTPQNCTPAHIHRPAYILHTVPSHQAASHSHAFSLTHTYRRTHHVHRYT